MDSLTYDITAWALPYVYGVEAYASRTALTVGRSTFFDDTVRNASTDAYGYVIAWEGVGSARIATALMKKGVKVRFTETPFETNGLTFPRGSIILLKKGNEKFGMGLWETTLALANQNQVKMSAVTTGMVDKGFDFGSSRVHPVKTPKVVLLTGEGISSNAAGEVWHFFDKELQ